MPTIAVDLDDTLIDTLAVLLDFIEQTRGFRVDEDRLAAYQLGADETETTAIVAAFYEAAAHGRLAAVAGALEGCRALRRAGARLVVVTARERGAQARTEALVERLFPDVFAQVHAVGRHPDKVKTLRALGARLLIDDNPRQIRRAADVGVATILFGELPWNRRQAWPRRARDWDEAGALARASLGAAAPAAHSSGLAVAR